MCARCTAIIGRCLSRNTRCCTLSTSFACLQGVPGSQWRPVCFTVFTDGRADAAAIKHWLEGKQGTVVLDLSDQAFSTGSGPVADYVSAAKEVTCTARCQPWHQPGCSKPCCAGLQAAAKGGTEFELSRAVKVAAVQQQFQTDKVAAVAAEHESRKKKEAESYDALKASLISHCSQQTYAL